MCLHDDDDDRPRRSFVFLFFLLVFLFLSFSSSCSPELAHFSSPQATTGHRRMGMGMPKSIVTRPLAGAPLGPSRSLICAGCVRVRMCAASAGLPWAQLCAVCVVRTSCGLAAGPAEPEAAERAGRRRAGEPVGAPARLWDAGGRTAGRLAGVSAGWAREQNGRAVCACRSMRKQQFVHLFSWNSARARLLHCRLLFAGCCFFALGSSPLLIARAQQPHTVSYTNRQAEKRTASRLVSCAHARGRSFAICSRNRYLRENSSQTESP